MKTYSIKWSKDASEELKCLIKYLVGKSGTASAGKIYDKLISKVDDLKNYPYKGRYVPELEKLGIVSIHELIVYPWRIFYRIDENNVFIISIIDGRRNIEEILFSKMNDRNFK